MPCNGSRLQLWSAESKHQIRQKVERDSESDKYHVGAPNRKTEIQQDLDDLCFIQIPVRTCDRRGIRYDSVRYGAHVGTDVVYFAQ